MSITGIYVFTTTTFTVDVPSPIEQLAPNGHGGYTVVAKRLEAGQQFALPAGAYRLSSGATITAAPGSVVANLSDLPKPTGYLLTVFSKSGWPDPPATTVSAALAIPVSALTPFFNDAGDETVLAAAP